MTSTPASTWHRPADLWLEIIERYFAYSQIPTWRAQEFKRDGSTPSSTSKSLEGALLIRAGLFRVIEAVAAKRGVSSSECVAETSDLELLLRFHLRKRSIPRPERCSKKLLDECRRAFLFNRDGYSCQYCGRTVWGVLAEETGQEPRRALRLELDHRVSRRRTPEPDRFDPRNLVVACRSCNAIKGEMRERRFLIELRSLAGAVSQLADERSLD